MDNQWWPLINMLYSLVIWMSYNIIWVWVWLLLERDIIVGIYSTSSHKTYVSPTVWSPKKPSDEINGTNDSPNNDLLKVKLNKGPHPVTYDPPPHKIWDLPLFQLSMEYLHT